MSDIIKNSNKKKPVDEEFAHFVKKYTYNLDELKSNSNYLGNFKWLSESIQTGKSNLKINTVDFIVIKILNRKNDIVNLSRQNSFDVFVLGSFKKYFTTTYKVAQTFSDFYLKMGILPNIISVPRHIFLSNKNIYLNRIRNGVLIYERR